MNSWKLKWTLVCILGALLCGGSVVKAIGPSRPSNDYCRNATPIREVSNLTFDTTNATFDGPGTCINSPNIWYCYTATCTGIATVSLCSSSYDTKLAVYDGCECPPRAGDLLKCNDDFCGRQSQVSFDVVAGRRYLIEVGGYHDRTGQGKISITCEPRVRPPLNDNCQNAQPIDNVEALPFDTTLATFDGFDGSGRCVRGPNIWYCYTAPCTGQVTISLCGSSFDTVLAVYKGCECYPQQRDLIGCNDDTCGRQSELTINVVAGDQYLIEVGGFDSQRKGPGVLSISCVEEEAPADLDFGDAPDSTNNFSRTMTAYPLVRANFPTVFNDGSTTGPFGPFHRRPLAVAYLGENVSLEVEADIGTDQDGLNNINPPSNAADKDGADDGIILPIILPNCDWATFDYLVNVINPGTDLWVNVWFDWNRDGDWDDNSSTNPALSCPNGFVSEWAVKNQLLFNLPAGIHQITTPAFLAFHPQSGPTKVWMRITLSEKPWKGGASPGKLGNGGSGPQAGYDIGETEDYLVTPIVSEPEPEPECPLCQDLNGDRIINVQDLVVLTNRWLQECQ